jgi:hypothetical protein
VFEPELLSSLGTVFDVPHAGEDADVSMNDPHTGVGQRLGSFGVSRERDDVVAVIDELRGDLPTDEFRRPGDEVHAD